MKRHDQTEPIRLALTSLAGCLAVMITSAAHAADPAVTAQMPATLDMLRHAIGMHAAQGHGQVPALAEYFARQLEATSFRSFATLTPTSCSARRRACSLNSVL